MCGICLSWPRQTVSSHIRRSPMERPCHLTRAIAGRRNMYQIGQYIMYGSIGVCRVKDIADGAAIGPGGRPLLCARFRFTKAGPSTRRLMRPRCSCSRSSHATRPKRSLTAFLLWRLSPTTHATCKSCARTIRRRPKAMTAPHLLALTKSIRAKRPPAAAPWPQAGPSR